MRLQIVPTVFAVALVGAVGFALLRRSTDPIPRAPEADRPTATAPAALALEATDQPLPLNHPAIHSAKGPGSVPASSMPAARDEPVAITWTVPVGWAPVENRSALRLATYRVPSPSKPGLAAELSVTRAGGSTDENLERWVGQFDQAGPEVRTKRTAAGLPVTTLEVSGTYDGGMSSPGGSPSLPGWSLLGAVVETTGPFYFFKLVGPADAVRAARPAFDALLSSIRQSS